jgi:GNAT superfamily N-acetyltransferase
MAPIEADAGLAPLVGMRAADVSAAFALSEEAGWNQTAEDWSLLIRLGRAFAVAGPEGALVATAVALPYPPDFGWIGMVIVHGPYRRRGLATRLLERSIAELRDRGLVPVLDATPAGQPVYERMGFRPVLALTRWRGRGGGAAAPALPPVQDVRDIAELDRLAFGADRSAVLADLLARQGAGSRSDPAGGGFLLWRPGRTATYVGPFVARETETALALLDSGLAGIAGPVVIDVPERESEIADLLSEHGFQPERPFARMALDRDTGFGDPTLIRAIAAPELG